MTSGDLDLHQYADVLANQVLYWDGSQAQPEWRQLTPTTFRTLLSR